MDETKFDSKVELGFEHAESKDTQGVIEVVKSFLEKEKKKGNCDFAVNTRRKCDYCNKTLEEGDKFTTVQDGDNIMDKCENCEKGGK